MIQRRTFLTGIAAAIAAPYVVRKSGVLMPVKKRVLAPEAGWLLMQGLTPYGPIWDFKRYPDALLQFQHTGIDPKIVGALASWPAALA